MTRLLLSLSALAGVALTLPPRGVEPLFVESAREAGLDFTHANGSSGQYYMPEVMGPGAALFDFDGDGDLDVYLLQGQPLDGAAAASGLTHRLFRNDLAGGRLRFTDVTAKSGLGLAAYGMGVAAGDYDNDGDVDLYVTAFGPNRLFRNNGDGTFADVTQAAGVDDPRWSSSAAWFDYDADGDLDLYVANYLDFTVAGNRQCFDATGARDYCSPKSFRPVPDRLFRNDGGGRFTDVSEAAGITRAFGAGLGVSAADVNGDGRLDVYVANDAMPNQLWINRGDGTFEDDGPLSGTALNASGNPEGSMGIAAGDFDGDGDDDFFVTNIIGETFALYVNDGKGGFEDARIAAGLGQPTAPFTGFGADWFDYDNDGRLDLFIANGAVNIVERLRGTPAPFHMTNQLFHNGGGGRFREVSAEAGPALALSEVSRAAVFGDVDNDGDTDVLVTNNAGPVRLLVNQVGAKAGWIAIRAETSSGRPALGARVMVEAKGRPPLVRRVRTDGSYLASSDPRIVAGLGDGTGPVTVTVEWVGGAKERWAFPGGKRLVIVRQGESGSQ